MPDKSFAPAPTSGKPAERPPSPITFAPSPPVRPPSPIVFAPSSSSLPRDFLDDSTDDDIDSPHLKFSSSSHFPGVRGSQTVRDPAARDEDKSAADEYPGGVNAGHWTLTRYSTGQVFEDDSLVLWYDINEFELLELHAVIIPSANPLFEYQMCHLWNRNRHRDKENLGKKLRNKGKVTAASSTSPNISVLEYYADALTKPVELRITRIPRSLDIYVQPYWEGWVRILRIVDRDVSFSPEQPATGNPYKFGSYAAGVPSNSAGLGGMAMFVFPLDLYGTRVLIEWRERFVRIQNGTFSVLRGSEDEEAMSVKLLRNITALRGPEHLSRYLPYTTFQPPLDHPSVTSEILMPASRKPTTVPLSESDNVTREREKGGYNFTFPTSTSFKNHLDERQATPLIGSRNDPTYLPITFEEAQESGLRVVCLRFRKPPQTPAHPNPMLATNSTAHISTINTAFSGNDARAEMSSSLDQRHHAEEDPVTLTLEDMKQRAGDWGGVRSDAGLWRCNPYQRIMREPPYLVKARAKMRKRAVLIARATGTTVHPEYLRGHTHQLGYVERISEKARERERQWEHSLQRVYGKEIFERPSTVVQSDNQMGALFVSPAFAKTKEEQQRELDKRWKKEREKYQKRSEKEQMKFERNASKGKGKESIQENMNDKEKAKAKEKEKEDLGLGTLNVFFWKDWGKKKKKKKKEQQASQKEDQYQPVQSSQFEKRDTNERENDLPQESPSMTVSSEDDTDGHKEFPYSTSGLDDTEEEGLGDTTTEVDEPDYDDIDRDRPGFNHEQTFERASGPNDDKLGRGMYPPVKVVVSESDPDEAEDGDPGDFFSDGSTTQHLSVPHARSTNLPAASSVFVQVEVNTSVDMESPVFPNAKLTGSRGNVRETPFDGQTELRWKEFPGLAQHQSQYKTQTSLAGPSLPKVEGNEELAKRRSHIPPSPIAHRHTERRGGEDSEVAAHLDPTLRKSPSRSISESIYNAEEVDDPRLEDEIVYTQFSEGSTAGSQGSYGHGHRANVRDPESQGHNFVQEHIRREEEAKEREEGAKEQLKMEYKKLREQEGQSEWVCLDLGNDYAFHSFLRIVHQHAPHPIQSSFMDRYTGGKFSDNPPSPQSWTTTGLQLSQVINTNTTAASSPNSDSDNTSMNSLATTDPPATVESVNSATTSSAGSGSESELEAVNLTSTFASETLAPFPGAVDPRFMYPARIFATPPYPEWRINVLRRAQRAGMGDIGRPMEMVLWGREDPVIANASGALRELQRLGKSWGPRKGKAAAGSVSNRTKEVKDDIVGSPGLATTANRGWDWGKGEMIEDGVSGTGTIGQKTVGSQGTIKGTETTPTKKRKGRRRANKSKRTAADENITSIAGSGSSDEESVDGKSSSSSNKETFASSSTSTSVDNIRMSSKMPFKFTEWSDEEDEHVSELEWQAWQMDIQRHGKRQYAMRARREAGIGWEGSGSLGRMGWPKDPEDDMQRFMDRKRKLEPSAQITVFSTTKSRKENLNPNLMGHHQWPLARSVSGTASIRAKSSDTMDHSTTNDSHVDIDSTSVDPSHKRPSSQLHIHTPPTLHHSTSMHADMGLRRNPQEPPARRPSMPALMSEGRPRSLNVESVSSGPKDKGKAKEKSFWFGGEENGPKSPTSTTGYSWFFPRKSDKDKEKDVLLSSKEITAHSGELNANTNLNRSGSVLAMGRTGLLKKKESGDTQNTPEEDMAKIPKPQLRIATAAFGSSNHPSTAAKPFLKSPTSPTGFGGGKPAKRMRSDGSLLSMMAGAEAISVTKDKQVQEPILTPMQSDEVQQEGKKKKRGAVEKMLNTALDFVEGK